MYQLGKKAAQPRTKDLLFSEFEKPRAVPMRQAPVGFGHYGLVHEWEMLGNDRVGDCVFAGAAHETMLWNAIAKKVADFDDASVLSDYSAVTGYNPANPNSDQGTDPHDALNYRRHTGIVDANHVRHKIGAYVALEPGDWTQLLQALYVFDAVGIGFAVYDYAMEQFYAGKPWAYRKSTASEPRLLGYHYVPVVGRPHVSTLEVVTWAKTQAMTRAFYQHYCDEAYGIVSEESLVNGKTAEGFDLAALYAAVNNL